METQNAPSQKPAQKLSLRVLDGQTELAEEDLQKFLNFFSSKGKEILTAAVVLLAVFLVVKFLRETDVKQRKLASAKYEETRTTFGELKGISAQLPTLKGDEQQKKTKELADLKVKFTEGLKVLGDAKEPYKSLASVYQGLYANLLGNVDEARTLLASLNLDTKLSKKDPQNLYVELAALNVARTFIDTPATLEEGWNLLMKLAEKGEYSSTNAVSTLTEIAATPEQKAAAKKSVEALQQRKPELNQFLDALMKRLA